jgi:DUF2911 family protein
MINTRRLIPCLGVAIFCVLFVALAHGNDPGKAEATVGQAKVAITYNRPALKGRDPLKMIQPGQMWRLGADSPTTIESDGDLDFAGTRVPKGKHILLARLAEPDKWTLVVSSKPANQYEPSAKIAEIPLSVEQGKDAVDELTIKLTGEGDKGTIDIAWGSSHLTGSFQAAK